MDRRIEELAGRSREQKKPRRFLDLHGLLPACRVETETQALALHHLHSPKPRQGSSLAGESHGSKLIRDLGALRQLNALGSGSVGQQQTLRVAAAKQQAIVAVHRSLAGCSLLAARPGQRAAERPRSSASRRASSQLFEEALEGRLSGPGKQLQQSESRFERKTSQCSFAGGLGLPRQAEPLLGAAAAGSPGRADLGAREEWWGVGVSAVGSADKLRAQTQSLAAAHRRAPVVALRTDK